MFRFLVWVLRSFHWVSGSASGSLWSKPSTVWLFTESTEELHLSLHTKLQGPSIFIDCIGYCCVYALKMFFTDVVAMLGNGSWISKGWGQCTMNISHVTVWSRSLYHPPYEIICCTFQQKKNILSVACVCIYKYIYGLLYMMLLLSEKYNM